MRRWAESRAAESQCRSGFERSGIIAELQPPPICSAEMRTRRGAKVADRARSSSGPAILEVLRHGGQLSQRHAEPDRDPPRRRPAGVALAFSKRDTWLGSSPTRREENRSIPSGQLLHAEFFACGGPQSSRRSRSASTLFAALDITSDIVDESRRSATRNCSFSMNAPNGK